MKGARRGYEGSAIIMVLTVMTLVLLCMTNAWHTAHCAVDSAHKRVAYERYFRVTQGVMYATIAQCKKQFAILMAHAEQGNKEWVFDTTPWITGSQQLYARISATVHDRQVELHIELFKDRLMVCGLRSVMKETDSQVVCIDGMAFDDA